MTKHTNIKPTFNPLRENYDEEWMNDSFDLITDDIKDLERWSVNNGDLISNELNEISEKIKSTKEIAKNYYRK